MARAAGRSPPDPEPQLPVMGCQDTQVPQGVPVPLEITRQPAFSAADRRRLDSWRSAACFNNHERRRRSAGRTTTSTPPAPSWKGRQFSVITGIRPALPADAVVAVIGHDSAREVPARRWTIAGVRHLPVIGGDQRAPALMEYPRGSAWKHLDTTAQPAIAWAAHSPTFDSHGFRHGCCTPFTPKPYIDRYKGEMTRVGTPRECTFARQKMGISGPGDPSWAKQRRPAASMVNGWFCHR